MARVHRIEQCACGKTARYKVGVMVYPLRPVMPRSVLTSKVEAYCETCFQPDSKKINQRTMKRIASSFSHAVVRQLERETASTC